MTFFKKSNFNKIYQLMLYHLLLTHIITNMMNKAKVLASKSTSTSASASAESISKDTQQQQDKQEQKKKEKQKTDNDNAYDNNNKDNNGEDNNNKDNNDKDNNNNNNNNDNNNNDNNKKIKKSIETFVCSSRICNNFNDNNNNNNDNLNNNNTKQFYQHQNISNPNCNCQLDGCCRYMKGYDISGDEELEIIYRGVNSVCDCIKQCYLRREYCASYSWKWNPLICKTNRVCILYKNNLIPPRMWGGSIAKKCKTLNGNYDPDCITGPLYILEGGSVKC